MRLRFREDIDEIRTLTSSATAANENSFGGDLQDAPLPRSFASGWQIGKPDLVLQIPSAINVKASGTMPYQMVTITVELLKTQSLSQAWETQRKLLSTIGDVVVTTDASTLMPYIFHNCAIENVGALPFNGTSATYGLTIKGYYHTNSSLFDLI